MFLVMVFGLFIWWSQKKENSWALHFNLYSKDAYGLNLLRELLWHQSGDKVLMLDEYIDELGEDTLKEYRSYISVSQRWRADSADIEALREFVEDGGQVFLAAQYVANYQLNQLFDSQVLINPFSVPSDSILLRKAESPNTPFVPIYVRDDKKVIPVYRQSLMVLSSDIKAMITGEDDELIALSLKQGKGTIHFLMEPVMLCNLHLKREEVKALADHFFVSIPDTGGIIWETGARKEARKSSSSSRANGPDERSLNTPLRYILGQKGLKESWYVLMFSLIVFLAFHIRRRQRAMPLYYPPENNSLEEVKTLSNLYLNRPIPAELVQMKIQYLRFQLKRHFGLRPEDLIQKPERSASRMGVRPELVRRIAEKIRLSEKRNDLSEGFVMDLCESINQLYEDASI